MESRQNFSFKDRILISVISSLGFVLLLLLAKSWRIKLEGQEKVDRTHISGKRVCYALWHGRFLPFIYTHRRQGVRVLISWHRDGEYLTRIVRRLGFSPVRGSSTKGGARAVAEMVRASERSDVALTPDGPKGPNRKVQPGMTYISQKGDVPIVPLGISAESYWRLKSWDRFTIPKPFSRVIVLTGDPIAVSKELPGENLDKMNQMLEESLNQWTDRADSYFQSV
ncbi:MAG: lysophospholipid acyltransferase family protein [candidate division Zixibacteria bacterium]|nr:lysophospholipid acyltransferase family protein [candidate division Zixibacteria bacterium]